jgi:hypothetical protein
MLVWRAFLSKVTLLGLVCGLYGCVANSPPVPGVSHEPRVIAIRNMSGRQAQAMTIQEDRDAADGPRRMGGMAPVMPNFTYRFGRADGAPPLPAKVRVIFNFPGGAEQVRVIDLRQVVRQAAGDENEAVVFELRADGSVVAYLDHVRP